MHQNNLKIALIQIPSLPIEKAKLDYFLMIAREKKANIAILPEYTTNLFFKELEHASASLIEEQSIKQEENLKKLSSIYGIAIVAPMIIFKSKKPYKTISLFTGGVVKHYYQYLLMPYKHWNERAFFSNSDTEYKPFVFQIQGMKLALMSGFESHFDGVWQKISEKKPDAILIPCASTFESANRWRELFKMRAFTNSVYIVRANRIGEYVDPKNLTKWLFYGDSFVVDPYGEIDDSLGDQEELLMAELSRSEVVNSRKLWQFGKIGQLV